MRLNLFRSKDETAGFITGAVLGSSLYLFSIGHPDFVPTFSNFFENIFLIISLSFVLATLVSLLHYVVVNFDNISPPFILILMVPHFIILMLINIAGGGYFNHYIPAFSEGFFVASLMNLLLLIMLTTYLALRIKTNDEK